MCPGIISPPAGVFTQAGSDVKADILFFNKDRDREEKNYDLKAVNSNRVEELDTRTPDELLSITEQKGQEIQEALEILRSL